MKLTISASIASPQDDFEKGFYVPICVQTIYRQVLEPICERNGLFLLADFGSGVDVGFEDFSQFIAEVTAFLSLLKNDTSIGEGIKKHLGERFEMLIKEMREVFSKRKNIKFSIG